MRGSASHHGRRNQCPKGRSQLSNVLDADTRDLLLMAEGRESKALSAFAEELARPAVRKGQSLTCPVALGTFLGWKSALSA